MLHRLRTAWQIYRASWNDRRTPFAAKALPIVALLYLLSPLDIIPDVIPVLGQMDDVAILITLLLWAFRLIPQDVKHDVKKRREVIDVETK